MTNKKQTIDNAIAATFEVMAINLNQAALLAEEAQKAAQAGELNMAFGATANFETALTEIQALYTAAVAMRRSQH